MAKRAAVKFRFCITGDGRNETIVRQPLTPNSDMTIVTGGNVSLNSPGVVSRSVLQPGWNLLVDPEQYLTPPTARNYVAVIPPQGATFPLVLAGSTMDVGVSLTPGMPLVLALPPGPAPMYIYNGGPTGQLVQHCAF